MAEKKCCCEKKTERNEEEYNDLIKRLNRVEGQIRGIKRMLEEDAYCIDILTQASAANSAINSFSRQLLSNHIKNCVATDIQSGSDEKLDELIATLQKMIK